MANHYAWIDMNAPFHGKFVDNLLPGCPTNQYDRRIELANKYGNGAGVDWRKELSDYSDYLKQKKRKLPWLHIRFIRLLIIKK